MFGFKNYDFVGPLLKRGPRPMQVERDDNDCEEQQTDYGQTFHISTLRQPPRILHE
jgi:hypothetical protein